MIDFSGNYLALLDCNNFYASCQTSFQPWLKKRAIVVLSNNDGSVVALNPLAKALGIKREKHFYEIKHLVAPHNMAVFSSNYTLYGSMSARIMSIIGRFVEDVEHYSIDEAFMDLSGYESVYPDLVDFGSTLRSTINQWTRIPVSIGIAPTKSLCKVANYYAKHVPDYKGVYILDSQQKINEALENLAVGELWGVGSRYEGLLKRNDIRTAAQLRDLPDDWVAQFMTVNGLRLVHELRGVPCKMLEIDAPRRKSICTAPSFGRLVADLPTLREALAMYVSRLAVILRKQGLACGSMTIYLHTNYHKKNARQYHVSRSVELPHPSSSNNELLAYAQAVLDVLYKPGYEFLKVGLMLIDLVPDSFEQTDLFTPPADKRLKNLYKAVDRLNDRFGRNRVRLVAQGLSASGTPADWPMKQRFLSPSYTTNWNDILKAK